MNITVVSRRSMRGTKTEQSSSAGVSVKYDQPMQPARSPPVCHRDLDGVLSANESSIIGDESGVTNRISSMGRTWASIVLSALLAAFALLGCKDFPGADGRYATHEDAHDQRHGSP